MCIGDYLYKIVKFDEKSKIVLQEVDKKNWLLKRAWRSGIRMGHMNLPYTLDSYILEDKASQCGYVVSTSAFRQGVPGSNPIAARKSCEVYPGLGILQPQWNPYPTLTPPSC